MPVNTTEILNILAQLADEKDIKVAISGSLKGAALTGVTTFLGGLILGPMGLAVGGIAGGLTAARASRNSFRPVARVILEDMSPSQQALLLSRVNNVLRDFSVTDLAILLPLLQGNAALNDAVVAAITNFVQKEMNLRLM